MMLLSGSAQMELGSSNAQEAKRVYNPGRFSKPKGRSVSKFLSTFAWVIFLGFGPLLWVSGIRLFVKSSLSHTKKIGWTLTLLILGVAIGFLLPLAAIRNRFLLLVAVLPLLAALDRKLARANRAFSFWFRACAFEICTVFASAAVTRFIFALVTRPAE